jgi:hypothetical protein
VFLVWGGFNLVDTARVIDTLHRHGVLSEHQELVKFLTEQRIRYARANYWDAYVVDFLSREEVVVGSLGTVRIPQYENLINMHPGATATIERAPCGGPIRLSWCIKPPPQ